jgi:hypothetical protein
MVKKKPRCLHPRCGLEKDSRGLCKKHHQQAIRAVRAGVVTWKELERQKKASPPREPSWFRVRS